MIQFAGMVEGFIGVEAFCLGCLVSFEETLKVRGWAERFQNVEQMNVTKFEKDGLISLP